MLNPRSIAAQVIFHVEHEGSNLDDALARYLSNIDPAQHGFIRAMCFGVMRFYPRLLFFLSQLMDKPIRNKEKLVECLLLNGLYELFYMQTPEHACVSETVAAALELKKHWAKALVNAVLRNAIRERSRLDDLLQGNEAARLAHPKWMIRAIRQDWPDQFEQIMQANNRPGPFTLRVNEGKISRPEYLRQLEQAGIAATASHFSSSGIQCQQAVDVTKLPGFAEGLVSVQDQAAQLAAGLLSVQAEHYVLDACAAPGGKTAHLLETCPEIQLLALDKSAIRLEKVSDNLQRLGLKATIQQGMAEQPADWWSGQLFDRILLDAPCSATGVIRRHPDIKRLRRAEDIAELVKTQAQMLTALWPLLKSGGMLLYSTCSILAEENVKQIQKFVQNNNNAIPQAISAGWGRGNEYGRQILPGEEDMDGFFYASIYKAE